MRIELDNDFAIARQKVAAAIAETPWGGVVSGSGFSDATPQAKLAVLEMVPRSEIQLGRGGEWAWAKRLPARGRWRTPLREEPNDFVLCIPVVNRIDLLEEAVRSVGGLLEHVVLVDQTESGLDGRFQGRAAVFRWSRRPCVFSEVMNWCQRLAALRGCALLGFMHNDAECAPGVAEGVLDECRHAKHRGAPWGVALTNRDSYCYFNMAAVREVGCWDESFEWYVADVDYYERLRAGGWNDLLLPPAKVAHHPSQTLGAMDPKERAAVQARQRAAKRRYELKWGAPFGPGAPRFAVPFSGRPPNGE